MPILDKPFNFNEMLRRTIFKGRPNFFNAKDFNKELELIHSFMEEFNKVFAVHSDIEFTITNFDENFNNGTLQWTRNLNISWGDATVLYKGVKFSVSSGVSGSFSHVYNQLNTSVTPKDVRPSTYIALKATLDTVTYADNPALCGIQADEIQDSVPTVDVEQYKDVEIFLTGDVNDFDDSTICILGIIHPKYAFDGSFEGYGFIKNYLSEAEFSIYSGKDNKFQNLTSNNTLFEYITERLSMNLNKVYNEPQLVNKFNLADLTDREKARKNLGLDKVINAKQLAAKNNLSDLEDAAVSRANLGLGSSATYNIGSGANDIHLGSPIPVGLIAMWAGSPSAIPTGWKLCNGSNNTPNLSGRFVVGYNSQDSAFSPMGQTGGGKSVELTEDNIPRLEHEVNDDGHNHNIEIRRGAMLADESKAAGGEGNDDTRKLWDEQSPNGVTENAETGISVDAHGRVNPDPVGTLPPYYTLCYIQFEGLEDTEQEEIETTEDLVFEFSSPDNSSDGGYDKFEKVTLGNKESTDMGSGITLSNPK
tara:strand:+ start:43357 stop:44958 length:1602 start_codon:yes stop_codon:yes gene_type:complete